MEIDKLNLNELKRLFQVFCNKDSDTVLLMDDFTIDGIYGRYYSVHSYGDYLCCKCSDGRVLEMQLENNKNDSYILRYKYKFDNSSSISNSIKIFTGNKEYLGDEMDLINNATISLSTGKNIEIINNFEFNTSYHGNRLYGYEYDEDEGYHFGESFSFKMNDDGILFSDGYTKFLISSDLSKVISINDKMAPNFDECEKFDSEIEFSKIKRILNEHKESLHPFVINDIDCIKGVLGDLYLKNSKTADVCDKNLLKCKKELEKIKNLVYNLNKMLFCEKEVTKFIEIINIALNKSKLETKSLRKVLK